MTYHSFLRRVTQAKEANPEWRYGQALFNVLCSVRPDLSEQVRTTPLDPFFRDIDNINPALWAFLLEKW